MKYIYKSALFIFILIISPIISYADTNEELFEAVKKNDIVKIRELIKKGPTLNVKDTTGRTVLQWAAKDGFTEIVKLFLNRGVSIDVKDKDGLTALMFAAANGHTEVIKLLLNKGAAINIKDNEGWTALRFASEYGYTDSVRLLLSKGADANSQDKDGITPLISAKNNRHAEIVKLFREVSAEDSAVTVKEKKGAGSAGKGGQGALKDSATGMEFVFVKGGCFQMGYTFDDMYSSQLVHEVCVDDFYMGKYEVTQKEWNTIMGNNPSWHEGCDNCPVDRVSWYDVEAYINKLNQKTGKKYRLPTAAEWEYAARSGGKNEKYAGTSNKYMLEDYAWYDSNSGNSVIFPHPVGQKQPNGLGIYDMSGNVWEWVQDWWGENYYENSPKNNPRGPGSGDFRVLRGGSYLHAARFSLAAYQHWSNPNFRSEYIGFRLVFPAPLSFPRKRGTIQSEWIPASAGMTVG